VPKPDPVDEWWRQASTQTKRNVTTMLQRRQRALLRAMIDGLSVIQEAYREGWDDLDETLTTIIETYESNLPKRYRRKKKTAEVIYLSRHDRGHT
jgi:hypothetical protein